MFKLQIYNIIITFLLYWCSKDTLNPADFIIGISTRITSQQLAFVAFSQQVERQWKFSEEKHIPLPLTGEGEKTL